MNTIKSIILRIEKLNCNAIYEITKKVYDIANNLEEVDESEKFMFSELLRIATKIKEVGK